MQLKEEAPHTLNGDLLEIIAVKRSSSVRRFFIGWKRENSSRSSGHLKRALSVLVSSASKIDPHYDAPAVTRLAHEDWG
jgi:hypothetical protein